MEYPVLLQRLFDIGVNGKLWRLIRNWYSGGHCVVRDNGRYSRSYTVERGVKQGSVLSPVLFLIVMVKGATGVEPWAVSEQLLCWWISPCR